MNYVTKDILKKVYSKRNLWSHKGQYGKLLVIAGSERHTGSAIFIGMAAYHAGCDLVYLTGPQRPMDVAANYSPVLITQPLEGKQLELRHISEILSMIEEVRATAVVIGPGLWRSQRTREAVVGLINEINLPMVLDADAIRAISNDKYVLRKKKAILTPHDNEFLELSGMKVPRENLGERIKAVEKEANRIKSVIVLKGNVDVISDGSQTFLNKTGDVRLTKGGCGDTLSGICGALVSRNVESFTAACASTYINGVAGWLAARKYGESLLPTDLIEEIPNVIRF